MISTPEYLSEVENALIYIRESNELSNEEKRRFFKSANMNLGISALCLSGGASFGYCEHNLVPLFICSRAHHHRPRSFRRSQGIR